MKCNRLLVLIVIAGCGPNYTSGKTQCSDKKECPSGYSCSDDGTTSIHYCVDDKKLGCPSSSGFYCSQTNTCWGKAAVCSTVTYCGTTKHPGYVICSTAGYRPDCNGDTCLAPGVDAGITGTGGKDAGAGTGGTGGTGGIKTTSTSTGGSGGNKDGGGPDVTVIGGATGVGTGGIKGTGGSVVGRDGGSSDGFVIGGIIGTAGVGAGGTGRGGAGGTGRGGTGASGGSTVIASLCSGTVQACSNSTSAADCASEIGCVWDSTNLLCIGTPSACSSYTSSTYCIYNGCTWSGALTCTPTTITSFCTSMTASTSCQTCILNSCCGQFTNCYNDANCSSTSPTPGPLWDAYVTCGTNCCKTACGY